MKFRIISPQSLRPWRQVKKQLPPPQAMLVAFFALTAALHGSSPGSATARTSKAVFAGGCFWGVQAVFQHVKGVSEALSGYSGGPAAAARYEIVGLGQSGHAEAVQVTFDPQIVSYESLLSIFLTVAHNSAERDRQGPDVGRQYRSVLFASDTAQRIAAERAIAEVAKAKPIATTIEPLNGFYAAEAYHQDFAQLNPGNDYIAEHDAPKIAKLAARFPSMFRAHPIRTKSVHVP